MVMLSVIQSLVEVFQGCSVNPHASAEMPPNTNPKSCLLHKRSTEALGTCRQEARAVLMHRFHPTCPLPLQGVP